MWCIETIKAQHACSFILGTDQICISVRGFNCQGHSASVIFRVQGGNTLEQF